MIKDDPKAADEAKEELSDKLQVKVEYGPKPNPADVPFDKWIEHDDSWMYKHIETNLEFR